MLELPSMNHSQNISNLVKSCLARPSVPAPAPPVPQSRAGLQPAEPAVKPRVSVLEKKSLDKFLRMASCNSASLLDLNQRQEATKPVEVAGIPLSKSTLLMHKEEFNNTNNNNINSDSNQKSNQKNNNNSQLRSGTLSGCTPCSVAN